MIFKSQATGETHISLGRAHIPRSHPSLFAGSWALPTVACTSLSVVRGLALARSSWPSWMQVLGNLPPMVRFLESWSEWESEGLHGLWQTHKWISHCLKSLHKVRRNAGSAQGVPGHLLWGGGQEDPGQGILGVPEPSFVRVVVLSAAVGELWRGACIVNW